MIVVAITSGCPEPFGVKLMLDHCHKTGYVIGWLCRDCNMVEGFARGSIGCLKGMIDYLNKPKED